MPGKHKVRPPAEYGQQLTAQDLRILRMAANGLENAEIGAVLYVSVDTIKTHMRRLTAKLGTCGGRGSRAHAVHLGHRLGLLGHPESPTSPNPGEMK